MLKLLYALTVTLNGNVYVADTGLTGGECIAALESHGVMVQADSKNFIPSNGGIWACETMTPLHPARAPAYGTQTRFTFAAQDPAQCVEWWDNDTKTQCSHWE